MGGMKILSLFDGMACGMVAMIEADIRVERYVAYEIDKYAIKTSTHNFPMIEQKGDVFTADFTEYQDFDFLVGGSPCTYWSIAQKNGRETEASGMGWELFQQYVRALHEAKPKYFIYENNKSMSKAIRASIDEAFGFEAVLINSALVSAQNRQRLYWVGKRNVDGTYSKVNVEQPIDRGIFLKDILESNYSDNPNKQQWDSVAEPIYIGEIPEHNGRYRNGKQPSQQYRVYSIEGKSTAVDRDSRKNIAEPVRVGSLPRPNGELSTSQAMRVYSTDGKSVNLTSGGGGMGGKTGLYAVPICHIIPQEVRVRKYTCDLDKLQRLLRERKKLVDCQTKTLPKSLTDHKQRLSIGLGQTVVLAFPMPIYGIRLKIFSKL
jgi:DNA (cytosine-5)-methyltransferase 3A